MPTATGRLDLEAALDDSPQTQATVANLEATVAPMKDLTDQLKETCRTLQSQQMKVSETLTEFNRVLKSFNQEALGDKDAFMLSAFQRLGSHVSEMQSWQEMLCTQLNHAVVDQFDSFLSNDLTKLESLKLAYDQSRSDHEQAMSKYARVSKKKETERSRFDANSELFTARKSFFQSSLHYYSELNNFQQKKKYAVLDPLLSFMHAQMAYFKMGHEILTDEVGRFLTSLNVEIQKVRSEYELSSKQQRKQFEALEQRAPLLCVPDPDPLDPFVEYKPPDLSLKSKSGYLFHKQNKWERGYYFSKEHLLYVHYPQKTPEIVLDLSGHQVVAEAVETDDRRYVFQIVNDVMKKPLLFQAECAKTRDEWTAVVNNASKSPSKSQLVDVSDTTGRERSDSELIRMERQKIRSWVQHEVTPGTTTSSSGKKKTSLKSSERPDSKLRQHTYSMRAPPRPPPPRKRGSTQTPSSSQTNGSRSAFASTTVQQLLELADTASPDTSRGSYLQSFEVVYLGSMEVPANKGLRIVTEAIRRIIAARALKNIMKNFSVNLVVTHRSVSLMDKVTGKLSVQFKLKDISYCAKHPDNHKLLGIISKTTDPGRDKHVCHVFEASLSGKAVCQSVIEAIRVAVKLITEQQSPSLMVMEQLSGAVDAQQSFEPEKPASHEPLRSIPKSLSTGSFRGPLESTEPGGELLNLMESPDSQTVAEVAAPAASLQPAALTPTTTTIPTVQNDEHVPLSADIISPSSTTPELTTTSTSTVTTTVDLQVFDPLTNTHATVPATEKKEREEEHD